MEREETNRVALLTPPGAGAIAVVRICGPLVEGFLSRHFSKRCKLDRCIHGQLLDRDRVIDDPVVVLSAQGQIADINLHGGPWVVRECLELARRAGFEILESGDALLDVQSILEFEMLRALPLARTELAIRMLLDQPRLWTEFHKNGTSMSKPNLQHRVREILSDRTLWWLLHPPRIAIVGVPNAGKSTLANQLFGQERSITADVPGTTRDWIGDWANIDGLPVHLLDTPGQRDAADPIEQSAILSSRREIEQADLKILVLDPTQPLDGEQRAILDRYPDALIVINKNDLPRRTELTFENPIHASATTGSGLDQLRCRIKQQFKVESEISPPRCWTDRQRTILSRAVDDPAILNELFRASHS